MPYACSLSGYIRRLGQIRFQTPFLPLLAGCGGPVVKAFTCHGFASRVRFLAGCGYWGPGVATIHGRSKEFLEGHEETGASSVFMTLSTIGRICFPWRVDSMPLANLGPQPLAMPKAGNLKRTCTADGPCILCVVVSKVWFRGNVCYAMWWF